MTTVPMDSGFQAASAHTAVLISNLRKVTEHKTGLISAMAAGRWAESPAVKFSGWTSITTMRLGIEQPFYEVAFRGKVYRMLARKLPDQERVALRKDIRYEIIRSTAPGLQCDGELLEAPNAAPNTPRSLLTELMLVTGAELPDLMANAYSIYHYRTGHTAAYPQSMTPKGYTLEELFLLVTDSEGGFSTFYETPQGTNIERWTFFLRQLDSGVLQDRLLAYVNSSIAIKEFGERGLAAMQAAVRLRFGADTVKPNSMYRPYFDLFPPSGNSLGAKNERNVGKSAYLL